MPVQHLNTEDFLLLAEKHLVLDVRSPAEYNHAHIPGAISLPLFSDEERKEVGTAYKQKSREEAIKIGLDFFGVKMKKIVEEVERFVNGRVRTGEQPSRTLLLHCWRGGMRSAAVAWLLDLYGFKVCTLKGGYKKFRHYLLELFLHPFDMRIIGGYTGSGKTTLLEILKQKGKSTLDLEAIAVHKGSAFGNIGMPEQPKQEMFENLLAMELRKIKDETYWVEDEAQRIGLVNLPNGFWKTMREAPVLFLDIPFEDRLTQIVKEYGELDQDRIVDAIGRISEKLGHLNAKNAKALLLAGNTRESFMILLKYYDKFYLRSLHNREQVNSLLQTVDCKSITPENADLLILAAASMQSV